MLNKQKGFEYEIQVRDYLISKPYTNAWLWTDVPVSNLIESGIIDCHNTLRLIRKCCHEELKTNPLIDTGIDVVSLDLQTNKYNLIQCKNGYESGLKLSDLAGFYGWMSHLDKLEGIVYYTSKLSRNILTLPSNPRIKYLLHPYNNKELIDNENVFKQNNVLSESENLSNLSYSSNSSDPSNTSSKIILRDYQTQALKELKTHFKNNSRGILSLMCGMGKTLISYKFSRKYSKIIIISPIRQFVKQNLNRFIEYEFNGVYLTISCDGTRHVNTIKKFIDSNDEFLISCTFDSVDVLYNCIGNLDNSDMIIIIDEFHNLSKSCLLDKTNPMYKLLHSKFKILFLSATPRIYELETDEDCEDELLNTEEIFGPVVYTMGMDKAIDKKIVCDYKIWLPSIHENNSQLNEELNIYQIDSVIKAKCNFILIGLLNTGSKKTIVYCQDTKQIELMIKGIEELNKFYYMDLQMQQITSKKSEKDRDKILDNFTNISKSRQLLFSVRILDECIDIPECDSVYITYPSESKIRTIQRVCRSTRKDNSNPYKIANVFVWCNEYQEILQTLSGIKEYDVFFKDKINLVKTNFYGKTESKEYEQDIKLVENYLIDIKEYKQITWNDMLLNLENWILENKQLPSVSKQSSFYEKKLKMWYNYQEYIYKNNINKYDLFKKLLYDEFKLKYASYLIDKKQIWLDKLEELKTFINLNSRLPSRTIDKEKNLSEWLKSSKQNIKNNRFIFLKYNELKNIFNDFIDEYKKYFLTNEEIWFNNYDELVKYINENKKLPNIFNVNDKYYLISCWFQNQKNNYSQKKDSMKNNKIIKTWENFLNENNCYFDIETNEDIWNENLNKLIDFINKNNKKPSKISDCEDEKKLYGWVGNQNNNYKNKINIMKNNNIINNWERFIEKYNNYFLSDNQEWEIMYDRLINFIEKNNKKPSKCSKDLEEKTLSLWFRNNKKKYINKNEIMKDIDIWNKWDELIKKYPILT
jgi:superfamily II DNA or RNA helicase